MFLLCKILKYFCLGPLTEKVTEEQQEVGTDSFVISNKLRDEWEDFFAEGIFTVLVPLYLKVFKYLRMN